MDFSARQPILQFSDNSILTLTPRIRTDTTAKGLSPSRLPHLQTPATKQEPTLLPAYYKFGSSPTRPAPNSRFNNLLERPTTQGNSLLNITSLFQRTTTKVQSNGSDAQGKEWGRRGGKAVPCSLWTCNPPSTLRCSLTWKL